MYPGNIPSSIPTKNTVLNSNPFALWRVISVTESSVSSIPSISLLNVIPSKKSAKLFSASCSSNSIATVKNSSKFCILDSASVVSSASSAFTYPLLFSVSLIISEIDKSFILLLISSIKFIKSCEFAFNLFSPYCSAFLIISNIDVPVFSEISCTLSTLVFPIPLFGSFITLFKEILSDGLYINLKYEMISFISFLS